MTHLDCSLCIYTRYFRVFTRLVFRVTCQSFDKWKGEEKARLQVLVAVQEIKIEKKMGGGAARRKNDRGQTEIAPQPDQRHRSTVIARLPKTRPGFSKFRGCLI